MSTSRRRFLAGTLAGSTLAACRATPGPEEHSSPLDTAAPLDTAYEAPPDDPGPHRAIKGVFVFGVDGLNLELFRELAGPGYQRLADRSIDCTSVFADYPLCAPTRASTLTGLPPHEHGQIGNAFVLSDELPTLIDHFAAQGVATSLFGKQHSNNDESDGSFGYDRVMNRASQSFFAAKPLYKDGKESWAYPEDVELLADIDRITELPLGGLIRPRSQDPDWVLTNEALAEARRQREADEPFFVNLQVLSPHHPYGCPEAYYTAIDPADVDLSAFDRFGFLDSAVGRSEVEDHSWDELGEEHLRVLLARLYGMHLYADELLRFTLSELDRLGLSDDVLFVFTSDHGEMAGNKGLFLKTVFEDHATRIALMLRPPGLVRSRSFDGLLSCRDILPTLGGLMGLPPTTGIDGRDHSESLRLGLPARCAVFAFTEMYKGQDDQPVTLGEMVRTERYKYCRFDARGFPDGEMAQLYDLQADPNESVNLAEDPDLAWLVDELDAMIDAEVDGYGGLLVPLEKV
ncbi:MAG: sulfatase-like hydrolase/transferase [Proteobacteria bacterium]|nr:sulfatase-like hydrolase/transferase [Pseudomonadota bacterium]MCP4919966.1 sulfatase-like hydrolase/transferase [Pseudomonadota bacterium]